jgi:hypothetical protein
MSGGARVGRRWGPTILAGAAALVAGLFALSGNLAAATFSPHWVAHHQGLIMATAGMLFGLTMVLAVLTARASQGSLDSGTTTTVGSSGDGSPVVVALGGTAIGTAIYQHPVPTAQLADRVVVGKIPARPAAFVDRVEARAVDEALTGNTLVTVCALTGGRGWGKSQVAAQVARKAVATGWPVVAWVSGETIDQLLADLSLVADALGVADPQGDSTVSAGRLRDALAARTERALLIIDNANDPDTVGTFVPTTGATRTIVTSTDSGIATHGAQIPIGVFTRDQSLDYLLRRTGRVDGSEADAVAEEVGDHPLGLVQVGAVLAARPSVSFAEFTQRLRDQQLTQLLPAERGNYPLGVAEAILQSIDIVSPVAASLTTQILRVVSVLAPEGVSVSLLPRFVPDVEPNPDLDDALATLVEASLLEWTQSGTGVAMHRLVARVVRDRAEADEQLGALLNHTIEILGVIAPAALRERSNRADDIELIAHGKRLWDLSQRQPSARQASRGSGMRIIEEELLEELYEVIPKDIREEITFEIVRMRLEEGTLRRDINTGSGRGWEA